MIAGLVRDRPAAAGHAPAGIARVTPRAADVCFGLMLCVALLVRAVHLVNDGAPVGVDGGNWLAFGNALLGGPGRPEGVTYPPVVPLMTRAVVTVVGTVGGIGMIGAVSAVAPAIAVYLVVRRVAPELGPLCAGMLLLAPAAGEMAAWGGYPQLLGGALVVGGTWALTGWLHDGDRRALSVAVVSSTLVLATSHAAAAVGCAVWVGTAAVTLVRGGRTVLHRLSTVVLVAGAAAAPLLPLYGRILPAVLSARHAEPALTLISRAEVPATFVSVHGAAWPVWAAGWLLAVVAVAGDGGRTRLGALTAGLLLGLSALLVMTGQPRVMYEIPLVAATGLALQASRTRHAARPRTLIAATALALVIVTVVGVRAAPGQRTTYAVLDGNLLEAIGWIDRNAPDDVTLAVSPARGAPFGWWVEGLSRRRVIYAAPLRWLTFEAERTQAHVANDLFHRVGVPTREGIRRAGRLGVDYILLTTDGPAHRPDAVDRWRHHVVFHNAAAVVIKVEHP